MNTNEMTDERGRAIGVLARTLYDAAKDAPVPPEDAVRAYMVAASDWAAGVCLELPDPEARADFVNDACRIFIQLTQQKVGLWALDESEPGGNG